MGCMTRFTVLDRPTPLRVTAHHGAAFPALDGDGAIDGYRFNAVDYMKHSALYVKAAMRRASPPVLAHHVRKMAAAWRQAVSAATHHGGTRAGPAALSPAARSAAAPPLVDQTSKFI